jgi:hypothetical protein
MKDKKINKSITIDKTIAKQGEDQAKKECRSFSSLVEYLLDTYIRKTK